jgi:lysophospholipase L1-like esterase
MHRRHFLKISVGTPFLFSGANLFARQPGKKSAVINAGVGGNTTADMLARIDRNCLAHRPDLTIVMAGTNDMNSKKYIPLPQYEENMRSIIAKIAGIGSRIILMPILPVYEPYLYTRHDKSFYEPEGHAGRKTAMNALIRDLASEYQLYGQECGRRSYHQRFPMGERLRQSNPDVRTGSV